jgi:DUF438 domain-containing protein
MSNKPRSKTPDPIVPDAAVEDRMKAFVAQKPEPTAEPTEALATVGDARVEQIKKANGGDRMVVRAASGKFTKATTAIAAKDARQAQEFLIEKVKNDAGEELSRKQHLRVALFDGAIKAAKSDKGIGGAVKAFEALNEDAALPQTKESMIAAANQEVSNPIRVVFIPGLNLLDPTVHDFEKEQREKAERLAKGPSFAEVTGYTTNPPEQK